MGPDFGCYFFTSAVCLNVLMACMVCVKGVSMEQQLMLFAIVWLWNAVSNKFFMHYINAIKGIKVSPFVQLFWFNKIIIL